MRAQCRSRSGATPSKARAPSNTVEASHAAWVRGPMIGTLPWCQVPSKKVQVSEKLTGAVVCAIILTQFAARTPRKQPRKSGGTIAGIAEDFVAVARRARRYHLGGFFIQILINWLISIRVISSNRSQIIAALTPAH